MDLLSKSWPAPWGACATDGAYPTPADVRAVIVSGLAHGWDPQERGGTFRLSEVEHPSVLELPGFLITDRLWNPDAADPSAQVIAAWAQRART